MAIRNFSFSLVSTLLVATFTGCDSLKTRSDISRPTPKQEDATPTLNAPPTLQQPPQPPQPGQTQAPPTFLNRELPKVGLILGPGGMKAFAHIGVLREFARARIPVHAVAGLEWGAVIGALYAHQGQANDAEWRAFKLREQDLPGEGGFLSSGLQPKSISSLGAFLDTAFAGVAIDRSKVDFACPAYWSRVDRFGWLSRGPAKDAMLACLPYPPLFTDNAGVMAAPFSVDEAAAHLRSRGANLIVLVNVLGQGEFLPAKLQKGQISDNLLWSELRREMLRARSPIVHFVINVNTSGHPVTDFAGRRALMDSGTKAAIETVNKLVGQYGF